MNPIGLRVAFWMERARNQRNFQAVALTALVLLALHSVPGAAQTAQPLPASSPPGSAAHGQDLFTGTVPLQNRGPACISCHTIAGLPFPNGGTLGPNLTNVNKKLGSTGMPSAMQTLFFNVMTPIYDRHPLTAQEQADLIAFFQEAGRRQPARGNTGVVAVIAFAGFIILLIVTHFAWRDRIKPVRRTLVAKATHPGGFAP